LERTDGDVCQGDGTCVGIDKCDSTVCTPNQCQSVSVCSHGNCSYQNKPFGAACDDGIEATDNDVCQGDGTCAGVDFCIPTPCLANQCQSGFTCSHGSCTYINQPLGFACDDGLERTDDDICQGDGTCKGTDRCETTVCTPNQCQSDSSCAHGVCSFMSKPHGTVCDDGQERTDNDICLGDGTCKGTDYCDTTICTPNQCQDSFTCHHGVCSYQNKPDHLFCDDLNNATLFDMCLSGTCVGVTSTVLGQSKSNAYSRLSTDFRLDFSILDTSIGVAILTTLPGLLSDIIPGVYPDDVVLSIVNSTSVEVSIATRPFAELNLQNDVNTLITMGSTFSATLSSAIPETSLIHVTSPLTGIV
jgi:hypothetical protein